MIFTRHHTALDQQLVRALQDFLPPKIYDFHLHFYRAEHYSQGSRQNAWPDRLDYEDWKADLARYGLFEGKTVSGLPFGAPSVDSDRPRINAYIRSQCDAMKDPWSRCLFLAAPCDHRDDVATALRSGAYAGIKVYHLYASRAGDVSTASLKEVASRTFDAPIPEFAPEWMWEILNEVGGVLMLHMVLPGAIAEERNQQDIIRLCRAYPRVQLVMAHAARSFCHRHSLRGLAAVSHLPNVWIDTSAVCEAESFANALRVLGPHRILYGSDYPVSEFRGRCVTVGDGFFWHHPIPGDEQENAKMTLVGIESLQALREALEGFGATRQDIEDLFWNNAMRCLRIPGENATARTGSAAWKTARAFISCGTGLLSKRAESFLTPNWPTYFAKAEGCRIWDADGTMWVDFVGGVGAVLLGYADPDVNRAVSRRLAQGSYCSLLAREEVDLARRLLDLHPGMGRVRYARGGGEAMALAVRIARAATGKSGIAFCGYHGWHDWYLAANLGHPEADRPVPGLNPLGVPAELAGTSAAFHYNNCESLAAACERLGDNLAAIVMEPVRSQAPDPAFLQAVHSTASAAGALLVVDEVTSGLRYGFPGISASLGLRADVLVYAKAMSNGIPFGVVLGKNDVMDKAEPSFISSSYWTDGLGAAASLAVLEKMERQDIQPTLWRKGEHFLTALKSVISRHPGLHPEISGMPVAPRLDFATGVDAAAVRMRITEEMLKRGFLLGTIIYLMHAHRDEDMAGLLSALEECLQVVGEEHGRGSLESLQIAKAPLIGRLA